MSKKSGNSAPFWKTKTLEEMTPSEWESLCDGCGRCCLHKFEDIDTGEILYTNVACKLLDMKRIRCTEYQERSRLVPTCLTLNPDLARQLRWMPKTCAYRLLAEGRDLEWWHPLVSGDPNVVHEVGISIRGQAISESDIDIDTLEDYIVEDSM
jgi:uncharacterized cysteine cluster protein YcgN (CxxCxxCC family)